MTRCGRIKALRRELFQEFGSGPGASRQKVAASAPTLHTAFVHHALTTGLHREGAQDPNRILAEKAEQRIATLSSSKPEVERAGNRCEICTREHHACSDRGEKSHEKGVPTVHPWVWQLRGLSQMQR